MLIILAVILGIIQALTEFLPISSSGHLLLARAMMDFDVVDGLTFDVAVHVGTLAAIFVTLPSPRLPMNTSPARSTLVRDGSDFSPRPV